MSSGLDGVVVARTVLSEVDGDAGRLIIRGAPLEALAGRVPFEAVVSRLWEGLVPGASDGEAIARALGAARVAAFERLAPIWEVAAGLTPIEGLRLALSSLPGETDPFAMVAAVGVAVPALARLHAGKKPVAPDPSRSHAADMLAMWHGGPVEAAKAAALDAYLVTVAEHGMNASTFTARVIASTRAELVSAVVGALGALSGPLHGGAPGPVLDMLDAIGTPERAPGWIAGQLAAGERLMGFGHRIYRVRDPRADVLKAAVSRLRAGGEARLALAEAVEAEARAQLRAHKPDRPLETNVEFYTAILLEAVGIERAFFTPVFAAGRVAGWVAHVHEQLATGRLLRPQSEYVGPAPLAV